MGDWGKLFSSEPQYTHAYLGIKCQVRMDEAKVIVGLGSHEHHRCVGGIRRSGKSTPDCFIVKQAAAGERVWVRFPTSGTQHTADRGTGSP